MTDTTTEAVEARAVMYAASPLIADRDTAATLRALAAERDAALAREARLREALDKAATQFHFYEQQHRAKGTPDADRKAEVNKALVAEMRAALAQEAPR